MRIREKTRRVVRITKKRGVGITKKRRRIGVRITKKKRRIGVRITRRENNKEEKKTPGVKITKKRRSRRYDWDGAGACSCATGSRALRASKASGRPPS